MNNELAMNGMTRWHLVALGLAAAALSVLFATSALGSVAVLPQYPVLAACSGSSIVFPPARFIVLTDPVLRLQTDYHATVEQVVEEHMSNKTVVCSEGVRDVPSDALKHLAEKLPPWRDPADYLGLRESDIGAVLLEYVRIYECTLKEHQLFAPSRVAHEISKNNRFNFFEHFPAFNQRRIDIDQELRLARRTLNRTLKLLGGMDRLRPVDLSLECLQRSSLDIRNILGLAADSASCLPRATDARGSLRDLPNEFETQ